jgi:hypothetical protein
MIKILQSPLRASAATATALILAAAPAPAEVTVTSERRASAYPTDGTFLFTDVPSNSSTDLANGRTFTVLAGTQHASGPISNLTNGKAQTNQDSVAESFFANGTDNIRIQLDLGSATQLAQINSYSWHANARAPQV